MVLPTKYGGKEAEWPFTEIGKYIDERATENGFRLNSRFQE